MTTYYRVLDSPVGPLTIAGRDDGTVTHLRMADQAHPPPDRATWVHRPDGFAEVADQLRAYFGGARTTFTVPLAPAGTEFQRLVWGALAEIPYGRTRTYGQVAERIGRPGAARAVGLAAGRNPVGIIVPCHRVVGADGSLTGYAGGLGRKQALLDLERRRAEPPLDG